MSTSWDDQHAMLVKAAGPQPTGPEAEQVDRVWAQVLARRTDVPRRRPARVLAAGVLAALSLGAGGVAVAEVLTAHTGEFPADAEDLELGGPGERLDPTAPDFGTVLDGLTNDIPFPDARSRRIDREAQVELGRRDRGTPSRVSTSGVRIDTARAAVCAWADAWVASAAAGDDAAHARATRALVEAPGWSAFTDVDPDQTIEHRRITVVDEETGRVTRDLVVDQDGAGYLPLVRRAVQRSDEPGLAAVLRRGIVCDPRLVRSFPQALPFPDPGRGR